MKYQEQLRIVFEIGNATTKQASRFDETCVELLKDSNLVRVDEDGVIYLSPKGQSLFTTLIEVFKLSRL